MASIHGVRIVNKTNGNPRMTNIFDMETGEKITNVTRVSLDITRNGVDVVLHVRMPFEYEGPARVILETDQGNTE